MMKRINRTTLTLIAAAALSGCGGREQSDFSYGFAERYPLGQPRIERIDVAAANPSRQDEARVARLGRDFVRSGAKTIVIFVPQSGPGALSSGQWVKQELVANGVGVSRIQWDARDLPLGTVRIAYSTLALNQKWTCSNLHEDVQQYENQTAYLNREWANFGCAYQSNMKAQVDNPNDFVRPRPEGNMDAIRAADAVRRARTGAAPQAPAPTP